MVKRKSLAWRNFPKSIFLLNFFLLLKRHKNDINHVLTTVLAELQAFAIANNCLDSSNVMNQKPLVNMCQAENIIKLTFLYTLQASEALESSK